MDVCSESVCTGQNVTGELHLPTLEVAIAGKRLRHAPASVRQPMRVGSAGAIARIAIDSSH